MTSILPYIHARSRVHKKRKSPDFLTRLVIFTAIVQPLATLPQIYNIWYKEETAGVSFVTWIAFELAALIWLFYARRIKDKPLIITSYLWVVLKGAVVIGLIIY